MFDNAVEACENVVKAGDLGSEDIDKLHDFKDGCEEYSSDGCIENYKVERNDYRKYAESFIDVTVEAKEGQLFIEVINSKNPNIHPLENDMSTTKEDEKSHGYGNKIIDEVVCKMGGKVTREDMGDRFCCRVCVDGERNGVS